MLLTEERTASLKEKADRWHLEGDIWALFKHEAYGQSWAEVVEQAVAHASVVGAGLLVIDTLAEWGEIVDENSASETLRALRPVQAAAASGLAVLLIHHHRKTGGGFGERVRGSSALIGGVDVVVELSRPEGAGPKTARVLRALGFPPLLSLPAGASRPSPRDARNERRLRR